MPGFTDTYWQKQIDEEDKELGISELRNTLTPSQFSIVKAARKKEHEVKAAELSKAKGLEALQSTDGSKLPAGLTDAEKTLLLEQERNNIRTQYGITPQEENAFFQAAQQAAQSNPETATPIATPDAGTGVMGVPLDPIKRMNGILAGMKADTKALGDTEGQVKATRKAQLDAATADLQASEAVRQQELNKMDMERLQLEEQAEKNMARQAAAQEKAAEWESKLAEERKAMEDFSPSEVPMGAAIIAAIGAAMGGQPGIFNGMMNRHINQEKAAYAKMKDKYNTSLNTYARQMGKLKDEQLAEKATEILYNQAAIKEVDYRILKASGQQEKTKLEALKADLMAQGAEKDREWKATLGSKVLQGTAMLGDLQLKAAAMQAKEGSADRRVPGLVQNNKKRVTDRDQQEAGEMRANYTAFMEILERVSQRVKTEGTESHAFGPLMDTKAEQLTEADMTHLKVTYNKLKKLGALDAGTVEIMDKIFSKGFHGVWTSDELARIGEIKYLLTVDYKRFIEQRGYSEAMLDTVTSGEPNL